MVRGVLKLTYFDLIKSMDIDNMAVLLEAFKCEKCNYNGDDCDNIGCIDGIKEFLNKEVPDFDEKSEEEVDENED